MSSDLKGVTVAVTASRRARELAHLITSHGGSPYVAPTIGIRSNLSVDAEAERFCLALEKNEIDVALFMTGPGVYSLISAARTLGKEKSLADGLSRVVVLARSSKPKAALATHGVRVDLVPEEATSEGILSMLSSRGVKGETIAVLSHGADSSRLATGLEQLGAHVVEFSSYSYSLETDVGGAEILNSMRFDPVMPIRSRVLELIDEVAEGRIDAITFTSPPAARNLFAIASESGRGDELRSALNSKVIVVAIGPPTKSAIEEGGVRVDVVSPVYKMGPMVKALSDRVAAYGLKTAKKHTRSGSAEIGSRIADRP